MFQLLAIGFQVGKVVFEGAELAVDLLRCGRSGGVLRGEEPGFLFEAGILGIGPRQVNNPVVCRFQGLYFQAIILLGC